VDAPRERYSGPAGCRLLVTRCISPISGIEPVSHPFTTSNSTTGCGLFTVVTTIAVQVFAPLRRYPCGVIHVIDAVILPDGSDAVGGFPAVMAASPST